MKFVIWFRRFEENFIAFLLVTMTLLVFVEVIMRFVFNAGIHWVQEVTLYCSAWLVLLGASWGVREGAHIGVDAFVKVLPPTQRKWLTLVALTLCLFYCCLFMYGSWVYLSKLQRIAIEMEDLPIEKWKTMSVLFIGFVLLLIRFLEVGWKVATNQQDGFHLADEAKESMQLADELKKL
ncbi:C4-dicarboxylate ABC transporter permease [Agarivorans sp. Toyoura001]|uniref:TRAP transporter small permease n=1 Tax=Agarivorans sp. Toyoura001 TaxID=2283141 RepID=UPI0010D695C1|nr:TRAP transporter small permease [Agarivorans sp. Toyoura001]GDY26806.1 C4-dicarboxylate ABC transporter permease [Agarivorans sp. Toyoura001]